VESGRIERSASRRLGLLWLPDFFDQYPDRLNGPGPAARIQFSIS